MIFPTFFNFSLRLTIRSSWSVQQLAPSLVFVDSIELLHLWLQRYNQSDSLIDHLVMSMCRVFICVVGRGCLLWPVHSLNKTLLAFVLLRFLLQGQICLLLQVSLDFLLLHSSPLKGKGHLFWVLVLESFVGLHRTIQLQLLQHWWLKYRLGLLWYWMIYLWKQTKIILLFLRLQSSIAFQTLSLIIRAIPFLLRDSCSQ